MPAQAQSDPAWSFTGFGTLGAVDQFGGQPWTFQRSINQLGASSHPSVTPDSRLGAQVNWTGGKRWEAALQGVLYDMPTGTPMIEAIQWAYVGYRPMPDTRIRVGRTSPANFLFTDSHHVGYALQWVRPPVDFYTFVPLGSVDGADLEQRWESSGSVWRAHVAAGKTDTSVTDPQGGRIALTGTNVCSLGLSREDGGLLMKVSYTHADFRLRTGADAQRLDHALEEIASLPIPGLAPSIEALRDNLWSGGEGSYLGLALQYDTGPWTFISEASQLWTPDSPLNARRGYASLGWRHGPVTYYGYASRVVPKHAVASEPDLLTALTPLAGAERAALAQTMVHYAAGAVDNLRYDQATVGVGLRWDFVSTAALKVQLDRYDVHTHGGAAWRFYDGSAGRGELVSVAIDFVFGQ